MQPNNLGSKQPSEDQPPSIQPRERMIQPLSSEDDIRKAAEIGHTDQPASSQTGSETSPLITANSAEPTNPYEQNSLVTEPIHRPPQVTQPQFQATLSQPSSQKSKSGKTIFAVVGLIVITALAGGAYFFLFNSKVSVSDLVQETVQETTFLRPKQWKLAGSDGGTFGDLMGKNGKSLATVSAKESPQESPLAGASDAMYEQLRTQLMNQSSVASIEPAFQNSGEACKSDIKFKAEPDTKKTKTAIGLSTLTGSCTRGDGDFTVKIHTVAGISDGRIRVIALGASNSDWDKNNEAFQAILDSIGQAKDN